MKYILFTLLIITISGCSHHPPEHIVHGTRGWYTQQILILNDDLENNMISQQGYTEAMTLAERIHREWLRKQKGKEKVQIPWNENIYPKQELYPGRTKPLPQRIEEEHIQKIMPPNLSL